MKLKNYISFFLFLMLSLKAFCQTPGFNYQALILGNKQIQIPGTDVSKSNEPLISENIILRFTISNADEIEYVETHNTTTDENGLVSLIVGDGVPVDFTFKNIKWDGKVKYLSVELKIINDDDDNDFEFLDSQKILYIPQAIDKGNIKIISSLSEYPPPYEEGELVWITNYGVNGNTTLIIYDGNNWVPVNEDYDSTNEFGLVVVSGYAERTSTFPKPITGNQVWNKTCQCIQVFDNNSWVSIISKANNGVSVDNNTIKLGGNLIEPTSIKTNTSNTLSLKGLETSANLNDQIIVSDSISGVLKQRSISTLTLRKELITYATDGQIEFSTPLKITSADKINVFRNGININFTIINNKTIKLEKDAICYKNDRVRIIQLY